MIDLSKIVYLRAKSKQKDVPPFAFDIATVPLTVHGKPPVA
jgi:hypothetical protein